MRTLVSILIATSVFASPALARQRTATLPDGTVIAVNQFRDGGLIAPSSTVVTVHQCPLVDGRLVCANIATVVAQGRSAAETVLSPIVSALGVVGGAAALRPTRISESTNNNIEVEGSTATSRSDSSAEGGSSRTDVNLEVESSSFADNYSPTTVATDDALVDSLNTFSSFNDDSFNTTGSGDNSGKGIARPQ